MSAKLILRATFALAYALLALDACTQSADEVPPPSAGAHACDGGVCLQVGECRAGEASAQFRSQVAPPAEMIPGTRAWASVTFDNCSGQTWSASSFAVRPHGPADESTWGIGRVALPSDVPDGARVTIPFEVTAPTTAGQYPFTWHLEGEDVGTLQEPSRVEQITVRHSADCTKEGPPARFLGWTVPSFVATGEPLHATLRFANCSSATWTATDQYALGSQADADNTTWGEKRVPLPNDVASQTIVDIPLDLTAPRDPGAYRFSWKIVQEGVSWLDEATPVATVYALERYNCGDGGPTARFVREDGVPSEVTPGQEIHATTTFANCGGSTWSSGFHVGAAAPSSDGVWSAGAIALPLPVAPGFAITVAINGRAPGAPGTYPYRFAVIHDGVGAVDDASPLHNVTVRCVPRCGDHNCGGDGCGGSCGGCGSGATCDGAYCREIPKTLSCGNVQWWNSYITYGPYVSYGWWDTDLGVSSGTPVQLRHASLLDRTGVYAWGYMPEFTDLVTGKRFRMLHLRPANQYATTIGKIYPAGYIVGLSGGDTYETGLGKYSTGAHLCIQTLDKYRNCFPAGRDACN